VFGNAIRLMLVTGS